MIEIKDLPLPSTFMSRIQNTGMRGQIDNSIKDSLVMQMYITPEGIKLRAYASKDEDSRPNKIIYPALSVDIHIPLIEEDNMFNVFDSFYRLVAAMNLKEEQITGVGKEKRSNQWIAFWGVNHLGKTFERYNKNPFIVDYVTPCQIQSLLKIAEEYFRQDKTDPRKVLLRYTAEFCTNNLEKTIINVCEANPGYGPSSDVTYLREGEELSDLSLYVTINHKRIESKEDKNKLLNTFEYRHPTLYTGETLGLGLEGAIILMSKEGFFEHAK